MSKILVLNGPNLNLLGTREPEHYGRVTLEQINAKAKAVAKEAGVALIAMQSNAEHELVQYVQEANSQGVDFIIFNPAAFTHTSIALRDAVIASGIPLIEVHLSNIHKREEFRRHSYFSDIAHGVICGLGAYGYIAAIHAAIEFLNSK